MAYTQYFQLGFSLIDAGGLRASMVLYGKADPTKTVATVLADATAQGVLLSGVTDCQVENIRMEFFAATTGSNASPLNAVNAEKTMLLSFLDNGSPSRTYGQDTPGVAVAILSSTDVVDVTNTAYLAWRNSLLSTGATANIEFTDIRQDTLASARSVAVTFRKRRRGQSRVSAEEG